MKRFVALILFILVLSTMLTGCGFVSRLSNGDIQINVAGQDFDVNDRAEQDMNGVDSIVIGAVSDNVTILSGGSKTVSELKGQCRSATKPVWLESHVSGSTLYIEVKYPQTITNNNTELTVTIPAEFAGRLTANTVSGRVIAEGLPFELNQATMGSISGDILFSTASCGEVNAHTISGGINLSGIDGRVKIDSVSGNVNLDYKAFAETSAKTISGTVVATIPQSAAFKVEFDSISGSFRSGHSGINVSSAKHGFSATVADGAELIKVNTTSGDFRVEGK